MAAYAYSAINAEGLADAARSTRPASTPPASRCACAACSPSGSRSCRRAAAGASTAFKKVKAKSLQIFSRQFATMIEAASPSSRALVILEQQTDDKCLAAVIDDVRARVEGGAAALARRWPATRRSSAASTSRWSRPARQPACSTCARPRRAPDREGGEDQAPGQGRDDLPDDRARVRDARPDRDADVPRPGLREDLRPARRRAADADAVRRLTRSNLPAQTAGTSSSRRIGGELRASCAGRRPTRAARSGTRSSCASRCRSATSCAR